MTIHRINETLYAVESENSDRSYTVNLQTKSCSCPDATFRNRACKHVAAVQELAANPPTALARAAVKAGRLTDEALLRFAREKNGSPAGCACLLELARRRNEQQPKPVPAGVLVLLEGASEAERARALEIYLL
jgi:hypothetical protein